MRIEREEIQTGSDTEFHMLRHFTEVSPGMMASVLAKGHSEEEVGEMLKAPGSRFHAAFANSMEDLLMVLFEKPYRIKTGISGNLELFWRMSEQEFPTGVGTLSVVPYEELSELDKQKCHLERNRGMDLKHLDVATLPDTWECSLILKKINAGYLFITAFPGLPALPLPDKRMDSGVYEACKKFWDKQVFLVVRK